MTSRSSNSGEEKREFLPTRQSLLSRLKNHDDAQSWEDFFNAYWKLIYGVAIKAGLADVEAQEVVQETIISVSKKMPDFKYDPAIGSFKAWLLNQTRWRIQDQFRKRQRDQKVRAQPKQDESGAELIEQMPDPAGDELDKIWNQEWQQHLLSKALERVKGKVSARQYQVFDLYVNKQWSVEKIQETLGVSAGQVYLAKHRISALVREEIQSLETSIT